MGKADFEPWFDMYDCGMHYPNPARSDRTSPNPVLNYRGDEAVLPVFIHKSCGAIIRADDTKPPRVCPGCNAYVPDEFQRQKDQEEREKAMGGVILG